MFVSVRIRQSETIDCWYLSKKQKVYEKHSIVSWKQTSSRSLIIFFEKIILNSTNSTKNTLKRINSMKTSFRRINSIQNQLRSSNSIRTMFRFGKLIWNKIILVNTYFGNSNSVRNTFSHMNSIKSSLRQTLIPLKPDADKIIQLKKCSNIINQLIIK